MHLAHVVDEAIVAGKMQETITLQQPDRMRIAGESLVSDFMNFIQLALLW